MDTEKRYEVMRSNGRIEKMCRKQLAYYIMKAAKKHDNKDLSLKSCYGIISKRVDKLDTILFTTDRIITVVREELEKK